MHFTEMGQRALSEQFLITSHSHVRIQSRIFYFYLPQKMMPANSSDVYQHFSFIKNLHGSKIFMWQMVCLVLNKFKIACLLLSAFCVFTRSWKFGSSSPGKASTEGTEDSQGGDSTAGAEASQVRTLLCEQLDTSDWPCTGHSQGEDRGISLSLPCVGHLRVGARLCLDVPLCSIPGGTLQNTSRGCTQQCHGIIFGEIVVRATHIAS